MMKRKIFEVGDLIHSASPLPNYGLGFVVEHKRENFIKVHWLGKPHLNDGTATINPRCLRLVAKGKSK